MKCTLYHGDCLIEMDKIADKSVDMILCDLPYGTTACRWDSVIPFEPLWQHYERIIKDNGAIVLTASQPFTSVLACSNLKWFKYEWIWEKSKGSNFLQVSYMPFKAHENVLVFYKNKPTYNPQKTAGDAYKGRKSINGSTTAVYNKVPNPLYRNDNTDGLRHPRSVQYFVTAESEGGFHPTQKPIALFEYLIKTYTNEGETVLDNCMGSGTTGVACKNINRNFIGIEMNENYFNIAQKRINETKEPESSTNTFF